MKNSDALRKAMEQAQQHIKKGEHNKARAILEKIDAKVDNPTVKKWLAQLDKIAPKDDLFGDLEFPDVVGKAAQKKNKWGWGQWLSAGVLLLCLCSVIGSMMGDPEDNNKQSPTEAIAAALVSDTPAPTNTDVSTNTPVPTATDAFTSTTVPTATITPTDDPLIITVTHMTLLLTATANAIPPTATNTTVPVANTSNDPSSVLENELLTIDGVEETGLVSVRVQDNRVTASAEIRVAPGTNYEAVADAYLRMTSRLFSPRYDALSAIIDDGVTAVDYNFDFDDDVWRVTVMESFNADRAAEVRTSSASVQDVPRQTLYADGSVRVRECPRTTCQTMDDLTDGEAVIIVGQADGDWYENSIMWYQLDNGWFVHSELLTSIAPAAAVIPVQSSSSNTSSGGTTRTPENCADAVAMGLTAQQAGQYSHLDRDGDGVACYGD